MSEYSPPSPDPSTRLSSDPLATAGLAAAPGLAAIPAGRGTDVLCIGHALVDRLAHVEPAVVSKAGLNHGAMSLVDGERAAGIAGLVDGWRQVSGGSAANTAAGIASLGGQPAFVGSVGRDALGEGYDRDLEVAGVRCVVGWGPDDLPTGQCLVLVTPDAQRTMATDLGAGVQIDVEAVERSGVQDAAAVYLEGYLFDSPGSRGALERIIDLAKGAGALVALSLSDPFLVDRYRDLLAELVAGPVDVLFSNEEEALRLTGAPGLEGALRSLARPDLVAAVTLGANGAELVAHDERVHVDAWPVAEVNDTTGAGDLFAAGALHGLLAGAPLEIAGRLGSLAAGEVVSHLGARPVASLRDLAAQAGLQG